MPFEVPRALERALFDVDEACFRCTLAARRDETLVNIDDVDVHLDVRSRPRNQARAADMADAASAAS